MPGSIAVIVPTFNAEAFVERAISSAQGQDHVAEIIAVDDASTDRTCDVVEALAKDDTRIRLIRNAANGGPSVARNAGIDAARSDWIAILDADDAYGPDRFGPLLRRADRDEADIVSDNLTYYDLPHDEILGPAVHPEPAVQQVTLEKLFRSTPTGGRDYVTLKPVFRRDFLNKNRLRYDASIRNGEDFDILAKALLAGGKFVASLARATYLYTTRESGTSKTLLDYDPVIAQSEKWLRHPAFRSDEELRRLAEERIDILRRRQLDRRTGEGGIAKRVGTLALALRSQAGREWLGDWFRARLQPNPS
ncbi:glycosyltransferase family 2 protein [Qipengyuania atrilutea]|uniref:Glycosyltransferase family 2 protein n=1 Tax=Qipengyuania atrilutea TaxID=2744473 RepID=A0A850H4C2_9SPHN|nr:glycosyltransferase family 2 protein [Actirhodobacter atriluteus]NVD44748.1 glycosyltransferase family 2 protein [Actirhodobacter atriluteus]